MSKLQFARLTLAMLLTLGTASRLMAAVTPHALFSEHAVLQQGVKVPVWGTTDQAEDV
jgi:sialate O-acetylesterase